MVVKLDESKHLIEMALSRSDAIDRCCSLGEKFMEHFHKVYNNPTSDDVNHWVFAEMQPWLNSIYKIRLKQTHKPLLNNQINDWFLTACSNYDVIISDATEKEIEAYDKFTVLILSGKPVKEALLQLNIINQ